MNQISLTLVLAYVSYGRSMHDTAKRLQGDQYWSETQLSVGTASILHASARADLSFAARNCTGKSFATLLLALDEPYGCVALPSGHGASAPSRTLRRRTIGGSCHDGDESASSVPRLRRGCLKLRGGGKRGGGDQPTSDERMTFGESVKNICDKIPIQAKIAIPVLAKQWWTSAGRSRRIKRSRMQQVRDFVALGSRYNICIVTTAALPWMTGTAVNPLLRAAYLAKKGKRVTLLVPWVHPLDQNFIFPKELRFSKPEEQEKYILQWVHDRVGDVAGNRGLRIRFYPARYDIDRGSIMPLGDVTNFVPKDDSDLCVLEEPEHLTWYHKGNNWRDRFKLVIGVAHTNYEHYAEKYGGKLHKMGLGTVNFYVCEAYSDAVIKLSDTLQTLPNAVTNNVHGVRSDFLAIGRRASWGWPRRGGGAYFIGKALWAKGYRHLLTYLSMQREMGQPPTHLDLFGDGEDLADIKNESAMKNLDLTFCGRADHAGPRLRTYKVFVNPSESEVLSTTTAEALAMGKYVILKRHPSNTYFEQFSNALFFDTPSEFLLQLHDALATTPKPLTEHERNQLSWEGATVRFLDIVSDVAASDLMHAKTGNTAEFVHRAILAEGHLGDAIRSLTGAGPISKQNWMNSRKWKNEMDVAKLVEESLRQQPPVVVRSRKEQK